MAFPRVLLLIPFVVGLVVQSGCLFGATNATDAGTTEPAPTVEPAVEPGVEPGVEPAVEPGAEPAVEPGAEPAVEPGAEPAVEPGAEPSVEPSPSPSDAGDPDGGDDAGNSDGGVAPQDGGVAPQDGGVIVDVDAGSLRPFPFDPYPFVNNRLRIRLANSAMDDVIDSPMPFIVQVPQPYAARIGDNGDVRFVALDSANNSINLPFRYAGLRNGLPTYYVRTTLAVEPERVSQTIFLYWGEDLEAIELDQSLAVFSEEQFHAAFEFSTDIATNMVAGNSVQMTSVSTGPSNLGEGIASGTTARINNLNVASLDAITVLMTIEGVIEGDVAFFGDVNSTHLLISEDGDDDRTSVALDDREDDARHDDFTEIRFLAVVGTADPEPTAPEHRVRVRTERFHDASLLSEGQTPFGAFFPSFNFRPGPQMIIDNLWIPRGALNSETIDVAGKGLMNRLLIIEDEPVEYAARTGFEIGSPPPAMAWDFSQCTIGGCPGYGVETQVPSLTFSDSPGDVKLPVDVGAVVVDDGTPRISADTDFRCAGDVDAPSSMTAAVWFHPDNAFSDGPARIFALSEGVGSQTFMIAQDFSPTGQARFIFRDSDQDPFLIGLIPLKPELVFLAASVDQANGTYTVCMNADCLTFSGEPQIERKEGHQFRVLSEDADHRLAPGALYHAAFWCEEMSETELQAIYFTSPVVPVQ